MKSSTGIYPVEGLENQVECKTSDSSKKSKKNTHSFFEPIKCYLTKVIKIIYHLKTPRKSASWSRLSATKVTIFHGFSMGVCIKRRGKNAELKLTKGLQLPWGSLLSGEEMLLITKLLSNNNNIINKKKKRNKKTTAMAMATRRCIMIGGCQWNNRLWNRLPW